MSGNEVLELAGIGRQEMENALKLSGQSKWRQNGGSGQVVNNGLVRDPIFLLKDPSLTYI